MFGKKKVTGEEIIAKSLGGFVNLAEELDNGIELCRVEEEAKRKEITEASTCLTAIGEAKNRAIKARDNILKLVSA